MGSNCSRDSKERDVGIHEAFSQHKSLYGVIHVVDWGYTPVRDSTIRQKMIQEDGIDTIEKLRQHNLKIEIDIFKSTCGRIRESLARCQRPKWLLIAVNKADLFLNDLDEAQHYYHPKLTSDFTQVIHELHSQVGANNLWCNAVPVSSWDSNFEWNGNTIESAMRSADSRAMFRHFLDVLSNLPFG